MKKDERAMLTGILCDEIEKTKQVLLERGGHKYLGLFEGILAGVMESKGRMWFDIDATSYEMGHNTDQERDLNDKTLIEIISIVENRWFVIGDGERCRDGRQWINTQIKRRLWAIGGRQTIASGPDKGRVVMIEIMSFEIERMLS